MLSQPSLRPGIYSWLVDRCNVVLMLQVSAQSWTCPGLVTSSCWIAKMAFKLHTRQGPGPLPPPPPQEYLNENLAPRMLAVDGTLFGLAVLCVLLRVYVRAGMLKTFGIDGE